MQRIIFEKISFLTFLLPVFDILLTMFRVFFALISAAMNKPSIRRNIYPSALHISERHVQALWYDGSLRPDALRTVNGTPFNVIDPGTWNLEAGPDFLDAVMEVDGVRRRGDVEVHLRSLDWTAHGHDEDPAYANVAAHVTWYAGGAAALPTGCVEVCLGSFLRARSDFSPDEIDLAAYPYARLAASPRPCETVFARNPDRFLDLLGAAGTRRIEGKARRLKTLFVRNGDRAQVFYAETMAALGYKRNSAAFRALAATVPWNCLPQDIPSAASALTCAAGLGVAREAPWTTLNVRPANSPKKRIAEAAALFAGSHPDLMRQLDSSDLASKDGQIAACTALRSRAGLGAGRAAAILANVVVPFALAENRISHVPQWLCPEDISSPARLTAFRMLGRDHNPTLYSGNGLFVQGLIHIHREICLAAHPDCYNCPLVNAHSEL